MTSEIEVFRAELKAAGEPWQKRGVQVVAVGFVGCWSLLPMVASSYALLLLYLAIALFAGGWAMLIVAFLRRRRWAKAHMPTAAGPSRRSMSEPPPIDVARQRRRLMMMLAFDAVCFLVALGGHHRRPELPHRLAAVGLAALGVRRGR